MLFAEADLPSDEGEYIFTKYITLKDGRRIYASSKGLTAFRIWIRGRPKHK